MLQHQHLYKLVGIVFQAMSFTSIKAVQTFFSQKEQALVFVLIGNGIKVVVQNIIPKGQHKFLF
ncbi:hypothetical protein DXB27_02300 [Parabacteroides gordonii]|nr:hypothetical protein DXB27_02300 [Parabacteroides gordonii]